MFGRKKFDDHQDEYLFLGDFEEKPKTEHKDKAPSAPKAEAKPLPKVPQKHEADTPILRQETKSQGKEAPKHSPIKIKKPALDLQPVQSLVNKLKQEIKQVVKSEEKAEQKPKEDPAPKAEQKPVQAKKPVQKQTAAEKRERIEGFMQELKQEPQKKEISEQKQELMENLMQEMQQEPKPVQKQSKLEKMQKQVLETKEKTGLKLRKFLKKDEEDEFADFDSSEEPRLEHSDHLDQANIVKGDGSAPKRIPLANLESMPKPTPKKIAVAKEKPADKKADKKEKAPPAVLPFKQIVEKITPAKPLTKEEKEKVVKSSLDGMFDVYQNPEHAPEKKLAAGELWRYAVLFLCIFGFLGAGIFVFNKIYSYHRTYVVNTELQELVSSDDYFQDEYLKKMTSCVTTLTPQEILNGKKPEITGGQTYTESQQKLVNKLHQLKSINPDTAGWITVAGTVVNYPVVWTDVSNYYLKHNFYGESLSSGTIYIDERNSPTVAENLNTVIYGHNMSDGSMFASLHDFSSATVFYNATIQLATPDGIYIYKPFSAHESDAYDNYFETDFATTEEFLAFCEQMQFISLHQTETEFDEDTRLLTLSTCKNENGSRDRRFAVHAVLVKVIR